ncbi:anti-sigma factor family protein [Mycobacterium terramassiliense]|uniref:Membrane protein n=1 Tax=Mycobacterium terramassiliense TaxID=1841859 RepID=A0A2U3NB71_9MYCO|nr:zf-HC2 domain-containing protein [Mycobacterium terramassiliense]SPM28791.1 membrane protein [Mycobacterium terramassiliense]
MMPLWRPGAPPVGHLPGHDEYAMWDAAYVLGSLSSAERREFEAHLGYCPLCRGGVGELNGIPALLSQLRRGELTAIDEDDGGDAASLPTAELLASLLAKVAWRRRRSRIATWAAGTAAAAVLAIGVFLGLAGQSSTTGPAPRANESVQPMAQVGTDKLASTVSLSGQRWGTSISMNCVCLAPLNAHHDTLAMVVVGRDGSRTRLATWVANPGRTAVPAGSTSTRVDQIASVQVISVDDGEVLLERSL